MAMRRRLGFLTFLVFRGIRLILPLLLGVIGFVVRLILTAVISLIVGIPEATDRIAREQQEVAIRSGRLPSIYARHFYWTVRVVAVIVVAIGWVCFSFTTVFLITLIF